MNYRTALLTTVTLASFALPNIAAAQSAKEIVGTWTLVAAEITTPDGKKTPAFGTKPTGMLVFTEDGRFIYLYTNSRPRCRKARKSRRAPLPPMAPIPLPTRR